MSPFGSFGDPFAGFFGSMGFPSMRDMMSMPPTGGNGTYYSYSSSYSSSGPNGTVYEETKSHRTGPGGVGYSRFSQNTILLLGVLCISQSCSQSPMTPWLPARSE
jgi:hypothetical protein